MTLIKSLLLGSATAFVVVAGAQAADLPTKKGAPAAQYVQICTIGGLTGFTIPGSDTCLKISGEVDAIYSIGSTNGANQNAQNATGFYARGTTTFSVANNTAEGPLLAEWRINDNYGAGFDSSGGVGLDHAWIKWAGLTAGYQGTFFEGYMSGSLMTWNDMIGTDVTHGVLAYTATFGGGFTGTISLEAPNTLLATAYGTRAPDVVLALDLAQAWGKAHLGVVGHNVNGPAINTWGYGVLGALEVNLPGMAGSKFDVQGVFTHDAAGYSGLTSPDYANMVTSPTVVDVASTATGWAASDAWSVNAGLKLAVSPTFTVGPELSYGRITYGTGSLVANSSVFVGGATLEWAPVNHLAFDLDLIYTSGTINALGATPSQNFNGFNGKLRVSRSF